MASFMANQDLHTQVTTLWRQIMGEGKVNFAGLNSGFPQRLQPVDIEVDGIKYGLLGVHHENSPEKRYKTLVVNAVRGRENWISEMGLAGALKCSQYISEVDDHKIEPKSEFFKDVGLGTGTGALLSIIGDFYSVALPLLGVGMALSLPEYLDQQETIRSHAYKIDHLVNLTAQVSNVSKIPEDIMAVEQRTVLKATGNRNRSLYLAEFLRAWDVGTERNLMVGGVHIPEVWYYLLHPQNNLIADTAHQDAALLLEDPAKFKFQVGLHKARRYASILSAAAATTAGYVTLFT